MQQLYNLQKKVGERNTGKIVNPGRGEMGVELRTNQNVILTRIEEINIPNFNELRQLELAEKERESKHRKKHLRRI